MKKLFPILFLWLWIVSCKKQDLSVTYLHVVSDSVLVDGRYRTFHFKEPTVGSIKSDLVFILHGSGGTGMKMMEQTGGLESLSNSDRLLLVYPDGFKKFWNDCRKMANTPSKTERIDENLFFKEMVSYFKYKYQIDKDHFFAIGVSGGGNMAYKLALTMPDQIKGIAAVIANFPDTSNMGCPIPKIPIPVLIANGTADPINPYNGGLVQLGKYNFGYVRSTEQSFQYWANLAGYSGPPFNDKSLNSSSINGEAIERYIYTDKDKPDVVLLKVIGGKHSLPKGTDIFIESWDFFKKQLAKNKHE